MSYETPQQDIQDLWSMYQSTKAQWQAVAAEKLAVLAQLTALRTSGTGDVKSISSSGEAGNQSWTLVSLQDRYDSLVKSENELAKLMYDQRLHAIKAEPGFTSTRVPARGIHNAGGW